MSGARARATALAIIAGYNIPSNCADQESVITRFRHWLKHDVNTVDGWFLPVAEALLATLAQQPLSLVLGRVQGAVPGTG